MTCNKVKCEHHGVMIPDDCKEYCGHYSSTEDKEQISEILLKLEDVEITKGKRGVISISTSDKTAAMHDMASYIFRLEEHKTHYKKALLFLECVLTEIENGFVPCKRCGDQEDTKTLDFVDDLKEVKAELLKAV